MMNPRTSYLSSHYFFSISTDQWMPVLVNLTAMDRTLPRHLTPPERFLPICPDATRDEESSPEATRSVPLRVPARRDPCRHPAVYRKRPSLLEGWILLLIQSQIQVLMNCIHLFTAAVIFHGRPTDERRKYRLMAAEAERLPAPTPTRPAALGRRWLASVSVWQRLTNTFALSMTLV